MRQVAEWAALRAENRWDVGDCSTSASDSRAQWVRLSFFQKKEKENSQEST